MFPFFHWIQSLELFTQIRESALVFPVIMTIHLACIAVFGGMILMTDLRLLGLAMTSHPISEVVGSLRIWKRIGFVIMVTCGVLLAGSKAENYYPNPYFWAKLSLLALVGVHALIFRPTVYNKTADLDRAPVIPARAKAAACLSLVLWLGIMSMGRMIGYWEQPRTTSMIAR
jgi:uncharacterized membrane protein